MFLYRQVARDMKQAICHDDAYYTPLSTITWNISQYFPTQVNI